MVGIPFRNSFRRAVVELRFLGGAVAAQCVHCFGVGSHAVKNVRLLEAKGCTMSRQTL